MEGVWYIFHNIWEYFEENVKGLSYAKNGYDPWYHKLDLKYYFIY